MIKLNKINLLNNYKTILKEKSKGLKNTLRIRGEQTSGVIECLLGGMIFFSPNFLFLLPLFKDWLFIFLAYNYAIIFLLVSTIAHLKFNEK